MGKGFQPPGTGPSSKPKPADNVASNHSPVDAATTIKADPHFKPWVLKFNGRRYETTNPWHVSLDPDRYRQGKYKLSIWRKDPTTNHIIEGFGHGTIMWGDQAIAFCLRRFYIAPVDGIKLTTNEKMNLLTVGFIALLFFLSSLIGC